MDIRTQMMRAGIEQKEVAKRMGIRAATLSGIIANGNPTLGTLRKVAQAIGCKVGDFLADEMSDAAVEAEARRRGIGAEGVAEPQAAPAMEAAEPEDGGLPFGGGDGGEGAEQKQEGEQKKEEKQEPALTPDVAFICPHCHEAIKLGFVK